ncbi:CHAT domain-containing protein [Exophiala viscosa]|uniref:CHAT domain-containing protein n=1 Tax=Exophiala viscosa TaxID=2486360 RepID=UPI0021913107|nr:CHAT domain-containing protein [Exophiala viscosa]
MAELELKLGDDHPPKPTQSQSQADDITVQSSHELLLPPTEPNFWSARLRSTVAEADRRLQTLLGLHEKILRGLEASLLLNSAKHAIKLAAAVRGLPEKLKPFLDPVLARLRSFGDRRGVYLVQSWYYLELAQILGRADEARAYFEHVLTQQDSVRIPDFIRAACRGAWTSYRTLEDDENALRYALREFDCYQCILEESKRSVAAYHVVVSRLSIVRTRANQVVHNSENQSRLNDLRHELERITILLNTWIDSDRKASRWPEYHDKTHQLSSMVSPLCDQLQVNDDRVRRLITSPNDAQTTKGIDLTPTSLIHIRVLMQERRYAELFSYARKMYGIVLHNKTATLHQMSISAMAYAVALQSLSSHRPRPSEQVLRFIRRLQYELLTTNLKALQSALSERQYLQRASLLAMIVPECLKFWPDARSEYVRAMIEYFEGAHFICRNVRRGIQSSDDLEKWIRRRALGGTWSFSGLCKYAGGFFLQTANEGLAWSWIQRGYGQALHDMLQDRETASSRVLMAVKHHKDLADDLSEEIRLIRGLAKLDPIDYFETVQVLNRQRDRMRKHPIFRQMLDGPENSGPMHHDNLEDIWGLLNYLPEAANIVLVDWFIDSRKVIWRLAINSREKHSMPRSWKLDIKLQQIKVWTQSYLQFPVGQVAQLELDWKALHILRNLVMGLEDVCRPGDLMILNIPGEMAGIPFHGIPFDGNPGMIMIERNPVIYSSGLNLYRRCLERALDIPAVGAGRLLGKAVFTSAYEQPGIEDERDSIFNHLRNTANLFDGSVLLGLDLTRDSLRNALETATWIHYHGHAYYTQREALNQCLVLGSIGGSEELQSHNHQSSIQEARARLEAEMPFEAFPTPKEVLLTDHLLGRSSRLAVADVFVMDISRNHPVVCNIACDSSVQNFTSGNDPLGLVSALFCAGASSVVGTLWPVRSSSGRFFTEKFYSNLKAQGSDPAVSRVHSPRQVLNLALAFREATLAIKKTKPEPCYWAAFVLHGAGFYFSN